MREFLALLILFFVKALRRWWQRFTGRVPVPVKVRARRGMLDSRADFFSRVPFDLSSMDIRRGRGRGHG